MFEYDRDWTEVGSRAFPFFSDNSSKRPREFDALHDVLHVADTVEYTLQADCIAGVGDLSESAKKQIPYICLFHELRQHALALAAAESSECLTIVFSCVRDA